MTDARTRWLVVGTVLASIAIAAAFVGPGYVARQREQARIDALFSVNDATRGDAIAWWSEPTVPGNPGAISRFFAQLSGRPEIRHRLLQAPEAVLLDIAAAFEGHPYWKSQLGWIHFRVLEARAKAGVDESGARRILADAHEIGDRVPAEFLTDLYTLLGAHEAAAVRRMAVEHAVFRLGSDAESLLAVAIEDEDAAVARSAWLLLAMIDPIGGYRGDWRDERPSVAEAALFAATWTSPDPSDLLDVVSSSPEAARLQGAIELARLLSTDGRLTADDHAMFDQVLAVLPVDEPATFAQRASSGTMPCWWLARAMETFAGAQINACIDALLERDESAAKALGAYACGYHRIGHERLADLRRSAPDASLRHAIDAGSLMAGRGRGGASVARRLMQQSARGGLQRADAIFASIASGHASIGLDEGLAIFDGGDVHADAAAVPLSAWRAMLARFFDDAPLTNASPGQPRLERLELDALRAWWICQRGAYDFDPLTRRYVRVD